MLPGSGQMTDNEEGPVPAAPVSPPHAGPALNPRDEDTWPALLTAEEVALVLRMHIETVRANLRSGRLPGVRLGGQWFTRKNDLLNHPQRRAENPPPG